MYDNIDANDPEIIREIARKHWDAINTALASGGDIALASEPQMKFLESYIPSLPPETSKFVFEVYSAESVKHAELAKRISSRQLSKVKDHVVLVSRIKRNTIIFATISVLLLIWKIVTMISAGS